jgi:hypothetical protein
VARSFEFRTSAPENDPRDVSDGERCSPTHENIAEAGRGSRGIRRRGACAPDSVPPIGGGETLWINVAQGRLKAQVFAREEVSDLTPAVSPGRE